MVLSPKLAISKVEFMRNLARQGSRGKSKYTDSLIPVILRLSEMSAPALEPCPKHGWLEQRKAQA